MPAYVKTVSKPTGTHINGIFRETGEKTVNVGNEVLLECITPNSKPPATVKWFFNSKKISQTNSIFNITKALDKSKCGGSTITTTITFHAEQEMDQSVMKCRAENMYGFSETSVKLVVKMTEKSLLYYMGVLCAFLLFFACFVLPCGAAVFFFKQDSNRQSYKVVQTISLKESEHGSMIQASQVSKANKSITTPPPSPTLSVSIYHMPSSSSLKTSEASHSPLPLPTVSNVLKATCGLKNHQSFNLGSLPSPPPPPPPLPPLPPPMPSQSPLQPQSPRVHNGLERPSRFIGSVQLRPVPEEKKNLHKKEVENDYEKEHNSALLAAIKKRRFQMNPVEEEEEEE